MLREYLNSFVKEYNGPQISVLAAGAGLSILDVAKIPGSSKVLHAFHAPYATDATAEFIASNSTAEAAHNFTLKCVSQMSAVDLLLSLERMNKKNGHWELCNIAITGAVTTSRYRRGDNHAYIAIRRNHVAEIWHLTLSKLPEEFFKNEASNPDFNNRIIRQRIEDDERISLVSLALGTGFNTSFTESWLAEEKELGHLTRAR